MTAAGSVARLKPRVIDDASGTSVDESAGLVLTIDSRTACCASPTVCAPTGAAVGGALTFDAVGLTDGWRRELT